MLCTDRCVLVRTGPGPTPHLVCFPSPGLIDQGEGAKEAAVRELKEETGYMGEVVGVTPGEGGLLGWASASVLVLTWCC